MLQTAPEPVTAPPDDADLLLHLYWEGAPRPGDVALCGHIKRSAPTADGEKCLVCVELQLPGQYSKAEYHKLRQDLAVRRREAQRLHELGVNTGPSVVRLEKVERVLDEVGKRLGDE